MSGILEWFKNLPENFKDFIIDNGRNPILWILLFFTGMLVFFITYSALNKNR